MSSSEAKPFGRQGEKPGSDQGLELPYHNLFLGRLLPHPPSHLCKGLPGQPLVACLTRATLLVFHILEITNGLKNPGQRTLPPSPLPPPLSPPSHTPAAPTPVRPSQRAQQKCKGPKPPRHCTHHLLPERGLSSGRLPGGKGSRLALISIRNSEMKGALERCWEWLHLAHLP